MFCSKSTKGFPWPKIWARAPYCVWQKDFSLAQGTFSAFLYSIYDPVFPPGLDRHSHRNIFQASNTTWFHSLFFFCCFFFLFFFLIHPSLCWPTDTWCRIPFHTRPYTYPSWHSSRELLCKTLPGPFSISFCIWMIYLCGYLSCTISVL